MMGAGPKTKNESEELLKNKGPFGPFSNTLHGIGFHHRIR